MFRGFVILLVSGLFGAGGTAAAEPDIPRPTLPDPLGASRGDADVPYPSSLGLAITQLPAVAPAPPEIATDVPPDSVPMPPSPDDPDMLRVHPRYFPSVWGVFGLTFFASGNKMAPNGMVYLPFGTVDFDLNVGLLPQKRLYLFTLGSFWAQKATAGVTNPGQGFIDFSKRQMDLLAGIAWNYWNYFEARVFAYSFNNLNRGMQLDKPYGYNDGVVVENRYYIPKSNLFDLPRLNFLSLGYYTSKDLTGADGIYFNPGLFARAYLTYEFVPRRYYVYADTEMIARRFANPKLLFFDDGFAARPFAKLQGLEFRAGVFNTVDVQVDNVRTLLYLTAQVIF
jgi:hypothetical protein